jgi:micrococcal nuclease
MKSSIFVNPDGVSQRRPHRERKWYVRQFVLLVLAIIVVILLVQRVLAQNNSATTRSLGVSIEANVIYVYDGDTVRVKIDGKEEKVRLLGINAPETAKPALGQEGQCYADEAFAKLKQLVNNRRVLLTMDDRSSNRDKYGRLLRYIFLKDDEEGMPVGASVNEILVVGGFAKHYTAAHLASYSRYAQLEADAKKNNVGLWAICKI